MLFLWSQCSIDRCGKRASVGGGRPRDVRRRRSLNTTNAASDVSRQLCSTSNCLHAMYNWAKHNVVPNFHFPLSCQLTNPNFNTRNTAKTISKKLLFPLLMLARNRAELRNLIVRHRPPDQSRYSPRPHRYIKQPGEMSLSASCLLRHTRCSVPFLI